MGYLDYAGLQYLWGKLKEKFAPKSHSHDDRYYTEAEMDGKLNSKVNNNEAGADSLLSKLTTSWTATPTDNTYFIRQDTGGGDSFGRVKFSTLWNYIKGKADGVYQPKGSYAASGHTHDDRYYTESEMNTKLSAKAENIVLASDTNLNNITTPGFYSCGGGNKITNKPNNTDAIGLIVTHNASGNYYTQILTTSSNANTYRRTCLNGSWSGWTQDKYTDTNTWRGIQNNLTSDSTSDSLSAAQGKALKTLVDGKAPNGHTHSFASITDKPSTYTPSAHNQSWSTITDKPALMESGDYSAETIEALLKRVQGLSPRMGSCCLTKDTHVANTWWNFIYTPHRTGSGGDNPEYGTLLLFPMVGAGSSYIVRAVKDGIVREVRKIYTSGDKPTKGDVGLGNVDNTADANKSVKYATSAGSASTATRATTAGTADKANSVDWSKVQNKPSSYNPSSHTHNYAGSASAGGAAISANALNPTVTLTGEDKNTTGYRLIGQVSIVQWSNYRCVMLVNSRHQGAGLVTVTIGNNTNSITQENAYAEIKYWGSTNSGGVISSSSYQVYISSDGKTGYLFWLFHDYSPCSIRVLGSDFTISNGTWMTGIGSGYGKCIATTQINAASTADVAGVATVGVRDYNNANNTIKIGWSGADLDANTLSYVAGYTSDMKIHTASKDGVRSWLGLGNAAYKKIQSLSAVGHSDWKNQSTDDGYVPTMAFMAFWNGAHSSNGASNLQYCDRGRFGTIVTKSTADFAPASGSNDYVRVWNSGTISGTDNASINDLAKQHFAMAMVNNATDNPLGAKKWIHAINMAWNNGVNSSWVSQIALGVQDSYGMWFRTGQGAIAGRTWNRVYDSSYHPNADHASAADSATNATNATTATKLSSNAGSSVQPVYFSGGKPVAIGYTISSSVPANAKFTDTTYGVASSSSNGLMSSTDKTKLDDFSRVISIQKQIKLTTDWLDTGIAGNSLDTGTYVVQVSGFNSSYTQLYSEIYSGVMSWYSGTTNSGNSSEIFLHNAGLADNNNAIYLRTLRVAGSKTLKLQIACKVAATGTDILTFKFRRLI